MWIKLIFVISCNSLLVNGYGNDEILGKGLWLVLNNLHCDDPEQYEIQLGVTRRKINRTHDAFSVDLDLNRELNSTYGVEIIANKEMDGGFKFYQQLTDDSLCNLLIKYAGDNWPKVLAMANIDPPECPIPAGRFKVDDFVLNYRELEETGLYGTYDVYIYVIYMGQKIACERWLVRFEKEREDDCEDDDDDYF